MIYTAGHSNRTAEELYELLSSCGVGLLVDVRRYPSSRRHPHFNRPALKAFLAERGVGYVHEEALGGHRPPLPGSPHTALAEGLRGYADHMGSDEFRAALGRLTERAGERVTAVLCAEADPERCHRNLLADALLVRGVEVVHILDAGEVRRHELHPSAVAEGVRVVYAERQLGLFGA